MSNKAHAWLLNKVSSNSQLNIEIKTWTIQKEANASAVEKSKKSSWELRKETWNLQSKQGTNTLTTGIKKHISNWSLKITHQQMEKGDRTLEVEERRWDIKLAIEVRIWHMSKWKKEPIHSSWGKEITYQIRNWS